MRLEQFKAGTTYLYQGDEVWLVLKVTSRSGTKIKFRELQLDGPKPGLTKDSIIVADGGSFHGADLIAEGT